MTVNRTAVGLLACSVNKYGSRYKPNLKVRTLDEMFKKISESSENDPEQLAHTSENSPALSLSETDSGPVESESSQIGATKSDLEPPVSTTDTQQNKGNNKITELRTIPQRESQNS